MHKIRFPLGLRPRPRWGSLQRSPDTLAVFTGPSSKERAGENWARKEEGEEGKMMGHPQYNSDPWVTVTEELTQR